MSAVEQSTTLLGAIGSIPGTRTAVVLPELAVRITYAELRDQVEGLASALSASGIERTDRIALALPNGYPTLVGFLAASAVGVAVPLNPASKEDEFRFHLQDTGARLLLVPTDGGAVEAWRAARGHVPVHTLEFDRTGRLVPEDARVRTAMAPAPLDAALVLHTSGNTGTPKRVALTHAQLARSTHTIARSYRLTEDDVSLCVMPLFHVHGLVASVLATLISGGTVVIPARFNPLAFWRVSHEYGATWYSAVPTIHQLLLARTDGQRPAGAVRLRFIRSCSAPLYPHVMKALESAYGVPALEAYGMTEAAHQVTTNPLPPGLRKAGSVGTPTDVAVAIIDADGRHLEAGHRGEIAIQGPSVIQRYEAGGADNSSFADQWFRTGDLGYLDSDGYLTLVGRIKDLINRGGEKISPREIDDVLLGHPAVTEAVAFGLPHPTWGEEVSAAVVLRDSATESELIAYCRKHLTDSKCPKHIHFTQTIPRTVTGKIQRRLLAEEYAHTVR